MKTRSEIRKSLKQNAKQVLKTHYLLLMIICLISIMYGTEFGFIKSNVQNLYDFIMGNPITIGEQSFKLNNLDLKNPNLDDIKVEKDDTKEERSTSDQVLDDIMDDNPEAGKEKAQAQLDEYKNSQVTNSVTGRNNGIFAALANDISSGNLYITLFEGVDSVVHSSKVTSAIFIVLSTSISLCFWVFIRNMITAIIRRVYLEARLYPEVPVNHMLFFRLVKRWTRVALTLLLATIFETLWYLTIVGGVIKHYSYRMVPYIVAENPDIKPREAIRLSRKMMDGHKWENFVLDLTFIGWYILGIVTFGLVDVLWTVPYQVGTFTEYYVYIREEAKAKGVEGAERLNDVYLFEKAEEAFLRQTYSDIEEQKHFIDEHRVTLHGAKAFFAKNFGLWIGSLEEKKMYDEVDNRRQQIVEERAVIKGKIYPQRLSPLWLESNNTIVRSLRYLRTYTIWSIILVFIFFSFVGWAWEVGIHLVNDGIFVNRGVLHGPWLPIYGGGVAMIVVLLARWRSKPVIEVVSIVILCGLVEYFTSLYLEVTKGMRWWDYTGYFLNLNGRICGEGLLVFALGGMAAVYLLVPILDTMWSKLKPKALISISVVLMVIFLADFIYSGQVPNAGDGITDYTAFTEVEQTEVEQIEGATDQS